jgi:hypothetical protein
MIIVNNRFDELVVSNKSLDLMKFTIHRHWR